MFEIVQRKVYLRYLMLEHQTLYTLTLSVCSCGCCGCVGADQGSLKGEFALYLILLLHMEVSYFTARFFLFLGLASNFFLCDCLLWSFVPFTLPKQSSGIITHPPYVTVNISLFSHQKEA